MSLAGAPTESHLPGDPSRGTALPGHGAPEEGSGQGALSGHSSYLLGVAEHMALRAGDAELQQPPLLLNKPAGHGAASRLQPQLWGASAWVRSPWPRGPCSPKWVLTPRPLT